MNGLDLLAALAIAAVLTVLLVLGGPRSVSEQLPDDPREEAESRG